MTWPITSSASASSIASSASTATPAAGTLGTDAFMKLLIAQIQYQDPLKPMDSTEFVTQLAQMNSVQQSAAQTQSLSSIAAQLNGIQANDAVSLVGKQVTLKSNQFNCDGSNPASADISLSGAAATVTVSITDATGKTIRTLNLGAKPAGAVAITWDGRDSAGQIVPAGAYAFTVAATGAQGGTVSASQSVTGIVTKITYDQGYAAVVLDSGVTASVSTLVSVGTPPPAK